MEDFLKQMITEIKSQPTKEDMGSKEYILTKQVPDRSNEVVLIDGINLNNYSKNPSVLFNHNQDLIVGKGYDLRKTDDILYSKVEFQEETQIGKEIKSLVDKGFIKAISIGFIPLNYVSVPLTKEMKESGQFYPYTNDVLIYTDVELLEFSFVNVPANQEAVTNLLGEESVIVKNWDLEPVEKSIDDKRIVYKSFDIDTILKSGAVLNKTNMSKIKDAITNLQEVLSSAEPEANTEQKELVEEVIEVIEIENKSIRFNEEIKKEILNNIKIKE